MNNVELTSETLDGIVYVTLRGEVDMSDIGELRDELMARISNDVLSVVLDLSHVSYLDSAGLHLIHQLRNRLTAHGQQLALVVPGDSVISAALRLSGVPWAQDARDTVADALAALGRAPATDGA